MKTSFESVEKNKKVQVVGRAELEKMVFDKEFTPKDPRFRTKEEGGAFKYFWPPDLRLNPREMKRIAEGTLDDVYVTLSVEGLIIGLAGLTPDENRENTYGIQFVSVDTIYQGKGYGRDLLEGVFNFAKNNSVSLVGSSRSSMGQERLSHIFEELILETGVTYISELEKRRS